MRPAHQEHGTRPLASCFKAALPGLSAFESRAVSQRLQNDPLKTRGLVHKEPNVRDLSRLVCNIGLKATHEKRVICAAAIGVF